MSATFRDVVFSCDHGLVWCEFRARLQTLTQVRYQVRVYSAEEEIGGDGRTVYYKRASIVDSSWKRTPQKARQDVEDEVGILLRDRVKYEKGFTITIPIIDEVF